MSADEPVEVGIPAESMNHPIVVGTGALVAATVLLSLAVPAVRKVFHPVWLWFSGRNTRAYTLLLGEVELLRRQLEESRQERAEADERHSQEIAAMRAKHEADMAEILRELHETRRQLMEYTAREG